MPSKTGNTMPPKLRLKLANECPNLLNRVKLNPINTKHRFLLLHSKQVNDSIFDKMMILFESLMKEMYEKSSWGWDQKEKLAEWKHLRTRIIIVTKNRLAGDLSVTFGQLPDDDDEIIGFMCFRFEVGASKDESALYVYELHVESEHQRQGLGLELMRMAKALAIEFKMDKIMLTVFRSNLQALQFYNKLKYGPDKSSPAKDEADYTILSLKL